MAFPKGRGGLPQLPQRPLPRLLLAAWFLVFRSLRNFPVDARATSTEPVTTYPVPTSGFIMVRICLSAGKREVWPAGWIDYNRRGAAAAAFPINNVTSAYLRTVLITDNFGGKRSRD